MYTLSYSYGPQLVWFSLLHPPPPFTCIFALEPFTSIYRRLHPVQTDMQMCFQVVALYFPFLLSRE